MNKTIEQTRKEIQKRNLEALVTHSKLDIRLVCALAGDRNLNARELKLVEKLTKSRKDYFYSDLLYSLTYKSFSAIHAKRYWNGVLNHRRTLKSKLGRDVGLSVAAHDYLENIAKEISCCALVEEQKLTHLTNVATKDRLTDLFDQSTFKRKLSEMLEQKIIKDFEIGVIIFDLDNFKRVNDSFGHLEGDRVLKEISVILKQHARNNDIVSRYGGEEFGVILPETEFEHCQKVAERIRQKVEDFFSERKYDVTLSLGLQHLKEKSTMTSLEMIEKADSLLYKSKETGKNRLSSSSK
ncbi:MAG: GGDEF domain-containing protein [Proteobacteria bacterium]|nr:GGDEF domain-containing protein [Pseudomonadota bacterium]